MIEQAFLQIEAARSVVLKVAWHGGSVPKSSQTIKSMSILTDEIRYLLLKHLEQNPSLTQRELAEVLGISLGKTNYCLNSLIEKGWVKARNFRRNKKKLGYAYLLTPKGLEEKARVTLQFLRIKQQEYDELVEALEALREEAALLNLVKDTE